MKKRLTTAQLRYSSVVRIFLLLLCLSGGGSLWADEVYTVTSDGSSINTKSGPTTFTTATEYQATTSVKLYVGSAWKISSGKITATAQAQNSGGNYKYDTNYNVPTSGGYLIFTPSKNGRLVVNGNKNSGGNKYLVIQINNISFVENATVTLDGTSCSWNSSHHSYNVTDSDNQGALSAGFNVQAGKTYYLLFNEFNDWSFTGFTFTQQAVDIPDADFKFAHSYRNTHYGETYAGNPFTNTYGVPVTYSSSNTAAATVDPSTGAVTIQNVGSIQSTTITATFAGNSEYNAKTATYALNVAPALTNYTDIPVSALRYQPGVNGISATGMARQVGGFNLTFDGGDGIKCNNTNNFYFRTNGSGAQGIMQIAMDGNNDNDDNGHTTKYIKKIVFTAWNDPSLAVSSVAKSSGTLTQTGAREWTWTNFAEDVTSVNFTSQGENGEYFLVSNIKVYTTEAPTFQKVTPTPAFNRNSDSFNTGASVNISDLAINTTPVNFRFDYTYNAGATTLTHTPYSTNTTWPGTITGTAAEGTATISASFDGSSNPFYNSVDPTNVYTLTVTTPAKNTFVWDFTAGANNIDKKILSAATTNLNWEWVSDKLKWKLNSKIENAAVTQGDVELELAYGLKINSVASSSTAIETEGFRINKGQSLIIPSLKSDDIVTVTYTIPNTGRYITPTNLKDYSATVNDNIYTGTGTVTSDGDVTLTTSDALIFRSITIQTANLPRPSLSFANGTTVNVEIPYGSTETTYTNALSNKPSDATVTYSVLVNNATVDEDGKVTASEGSAQVDGSGVVSHIKEGVTIIRAKVENSASFYDYYCDYVITATPASGVATWEYSADSKEIDGENRPYQGTVTFTSSGVIANGTKITAIPGLEVAFTAAGTVSNISTGDQNKYNGLALDGNGNVTFTPSVNGYLSLQGNFYNNTTLGSISITNGNDTYYRTLTELTTPLIAGTTYTLSTTGSNFNLAAFTFRPAFLNPTTTPAYAAEQTTTFEAYSNTTHFPKLVNDASAGVRFSGNRSVVNLSSDGGVELVGGGTAVVRGKVISGENSLTAYYTLHANVLTLQYTTPTSGSTITTLDNNQFLFTFNENITIADASKVVVMKDATDITSSISVSIADSSTPEYQKTLKISNFPTPLELGSTYTIRVKEGCVYKTGEAAIANPEEIGTFTIESTEPPLTWIYPSTTSAVRIGTSIVLQTSSKIDENYPSNGVWATLRYEGDDSDPDYPMQIKAIKDDKNLVFKPTKPLEPNQLYTLTVAGNQVKLNGSSNMITKDKIFLFTTGTATGAAPTLSSSTPAEGATSMTYAGGTIEFIFSDNVELEPYSTVSATPVNGSESTARGTSEKLDGTGALVEQTLLVDSENPKRVYFTYNTDALKYDLYYELVMPANTVTGPGGMPNTEDIVIKFRMQRNPDVVNTSITYPHTWDFTNLSPTTITGFTKSKDTVRNYTSATTGFLWKDDDEGIVRTYSNTGRNQYLDQGNELSYTYISNNTQVNEKVAEMKGLRISMMSNRTDQLRIRTSSSGKYSLHLNGGTNYMTVPTMKAGKKLYIRAKANGFFRINSVNQAKFTMGNADADGQIAIADGTDRTYVVELKDGYDNEDVIFCTDNVTFYKMAVPIMERTVNQFMDEDFGYITDCQYVPVTYSLTGDFLDSGFEALYIQGSSYNDQSSSVSTTKITADANGNIAVPANVGVLLKAAKGSTLPVFRADVNTTGTTLEGNLLKAVPESGITFAAVKAEAEAANAVNFIYTNMYKKLDENGDPIGDKMGGTTNAYGFYKWVSGNGTKNRAYLQMPKAVVLAKPYIFIDFEEDISTSIERVKSIENKVSNDAPMYNLSGQRVGKDYKGIVVVNGRKIWRK